MRLVNGLVAPDAGEVRVEGRATTEWDAIELRRHIGTVLQDDGLFPHFSVARNIALVPELLGWEREQTARRVIEMLELMGLPPAEFAHLFPSQLSLEQRQRVGLARALAAEQPILLLDEPFGRLDPLARETLRDDFTVLCRERNVTAIFATHDLREALLLADKIALLRAGQIAFFGTPQEFALTDEPNARAYRATMDLPAWLASEAEAIAPIQTPIAQQSVAVAAVKEPGLTREVETRGQALEKRAFVKLYLTPHAKTRRERRTTSL